MIIMVMMKLKFIIIIILIIMIMMMMMMKMKFIIIIILIIIIMMMMMMMMKLKFIKYIYIQKPESILGNEMHQNSLGFWDTNGSPNPDVMLKKEKKRNLKWILPFLLTRVKIKESEKVDKYWDLARELKRLWNMRWRWY